MRTQQNQVALYKNRKYTKFAQKNLNHSKLFLLFCYLLEKPERP